MKTIRNACGLFLLVCAAVIGLAALISAQDQKPPATGDTASPKQSVPPTETGPAYTDDGLLRRPKDIEAWVFVGASLGLSYSDRPAEYGQERFHNVYLDPRAYREYKQTGKFPDKTMLAMAVYRSGEKADHPPKLHGKFEDELTSLEVAVKDKSRFKEAWAYFDFSGGASARETAQAFPKARCHDCHAEHGADDNVFVQFYPVLRRLKEGERRATTP